jgi:hypothetical protein
MPYKASKIDPEELTVSNSTIEMLLKNHRSIRSVYSLSLNLFTSRDHTPFPMVVHQDICNALQKLTIWAT